MTHPYLESAIKRDIKINQGALYKFEFTWRDDDDAIVDITTSTVTLKIASTYGATPLATYVSPTNITLAATAPTVTISVPATTTTSLAAGDYVYDIEIAFTSADVVRLFEGTCTITPQA